LRFVPENDFKLVSTDGPISAYFTSNTFRNSKDFATENLINEVFAKETYAREPSLSNGPFGRSLRSEAPTLLEIRDEFYSRAEAVYFPEDVLNYGKLNHTVRLLGRPATMELGQWVTDASGDFDSLWMVGRFAADLERPQPTLACLAHVEAVELGLLKSYMGSKGGAAPGGNGVKGGKGPIRPGGNGVKGASSAIHPCLKIGGGV
jgi:hypothetical protein